ncbi:MAG: ATP phosphoribosyltransferase regulatory subunit, partial [Halobacteria archaeon]|nr:ATP phosphoribosyltransferase regulatory subunit [Halobacteria archaeon]
DAGLSDERIETVLSLVQLGGFDELEEVLNYADNERTEEGVQRLSALADELRTYDVIDSCVFDPSIVRGLDYYTGAVFECFDVQGDLRAIFGGGRYDNLVEEFGGTPTPAVGFGIGDATLE